MEPSPAQFRSAADLLALAPDDDEPAGLQHRGDDLPVGSLHGEARMREAFGDDYDAYVTSGVPFYLPVLERSGLELASAVGEAVLS